MANCFHCFRCDTVYVAVYRNTESNILSGLSIEDAIRYLHVSYIPVICTSCDLRYGNRFAGSVISQEFIQSRSEYRRISSFFTRPMKHSTIYIDEMKHYIIVSFNKLNIIYDIIYDITGREISLLSDLHPTYSQCGQCNEYYQDNIGHNCPNTPCNQCDRPTYEGYCYHCDTDG